MLLTMKAITITTIRIIKWTNPFSRNWMRIMGFSLCKRYSFFSASSLYNFLYFLSYKSIAIWGIHLAFTKSVKWLIAILYKLVYSINCKAQQKYKVSQMEWIQLIISPIRNTCTEGFWVLPLALRRNVIKWFLPKQHTMNLLIPQVPA
jgi:hypothetical protein